MFINEVESIVGLSKKSIRFYEEEGLIKPTRNKENDYRIYSSSDVKKLKVIKFLRELNVSIKELKDLNSGALTLKECMQERIKKIDEEEANFLKIKDMCLSIIATDEKYDSIEIEKYFQDIRVLNKKGFTMREVRTSKRKKIVGAVIASLIFSSFFILFLAGLVICQFKEQAPIPWVIFGVLVFLVSLPLISMIYNLCQRIKEILGGEEDEASKY